MLLLLGALVGGIVLVNKNQDTRGKASGEELTMTVSAVENNTDGRAKVMIYATVPNEGKLLGTEFKVTYDSFSEHFVGAKTVDNSYSIINENIDDGEGALTFKLAATGEVQTGKVSLVTIELSSEKQTPAVVAVKEAKLFIDGVENYSVPLKYEEANIFSATTRVAQCSSDADCPANNTCSAVPPGGCPTGVAVNGVQPMVACAGVPKCWPKTAPVSATDPSITITSNPSASGVGGTVGITMGMKFEIIGLPKNLTGTLGVDYNRAFVFDSLFDGACGNNEGGDPNWSVACTVNKVGEGNFHIEVYKDGKTYKSNVLTVRMVDTSGMNRPTIAQTLVGEGGACGDIIGSQGRYVSRINCASGLYCKISTGPFTQYGAAGGPSKGFCVSVNSPTPTIVNNFRTMVVVKEGEKCGNYQSGGHSVIANCDTGLSCLSAINYSSGAEMGGFQGQMICVNVKTVTVREGWSCGNHIVSNKSVSNNVCATGFYCKYNSQQYGSMMSDAPLSGVCTKIVTTTAVPTQTGTCIWCGGRCEKASANKDCPAIVRSDDPSECVDDGTGCAIRMPLQPAPTVVIVRSCSVRPGSTPIGCTDDSFCSCTCCPKAGSNGCSQNDICKKISSAAADTNGDGHTDLVDFINWKKEYLAKPNCGDANVTCTADFNGDRKVDLVDFQIWKKSYNWREMGIL